MIQSSPNKIVNHPKHSSKTPPAAPAAALASMVKAPTFSAKAAAKPAYIKPARKRNALEAFEDAAKVDSDAFEATMKEKNIQKHKEKMMKLEIRKNRLAAQEKDKEREHEFRMMSLRFSSPAAASVASGSSAHRGGVFLQAEYDLGGVTFPDVS
jgi:trans-2-enoyl-CoA reductase